MRDDNLTRKQTGLDPAVDFGAHSRVIRWTSQLCQRLECVTSMPLSSFLGVSGGEGIATGEHTQMQTLIHEHTQLDFICWFPARSTQGSSVVSVVLVSSFWSSDTTFRVGCVFLNPRCSTPYWNLACNRSGQMLRLYHKDELSRSKVFIRDPALWAFQNCSHTESIPPRWHPLALWPCELCVYRAQA